MIDYVCLFMKLKVYIRVYSWFKWNEKFFDCSIKVDVGYLNSQTTLYMVFFFFQYSDLFDLLVFVLHQAKIDKTLI